MKFSGRKIQFSAKWTRRLALIMSILYLANPLHRPLNTVFHKVLEVFESPNKIIGHETDFFEDIVFKGDSHEHKAMQLESGHNIIDLITQVFKTSDEEKSSDKTLQKRVKFDKHIAFFEYNLRPILKTFGSNKAWLPEPKLNTGHPNKSKEPPRII